MRRVPALVASLLALVLTGCVLFPGAPPFGPAETTVVVENQSDADLVVRFRSPDFPQSFAAPALTAGDAHLFIGVPDHVELLTTDCTVIAELPVDGPLTHLRIARDGTSISIPGGAPPDATRTLAEYYECEGFGGDPVLDGGDPAALAGLEGTVVLLGSGGGVWSLTLPDGEIAQLSGPRDLGMEGSLSPDGTQVAVTRYGATSAGSSVWLVEVGGDEGRLLLENASLPAWSPDGRWVAAADADPFGGGLRVVEVATGTTVPIEGAAAMAAPVWSPDGTQLAYVEAGSAMDPFGGSNGTVHVVSLEGEGRELAELPAYGGLAWSPDGTRLAVDTWDGVKTQLVVLDPESGRSLYRHDAGLASSAAPAWSPDGEQLAFVRGTAFGASKVIVADADGDAWAEIGEVAAFALYPPLVWSADGSHLLAVTGDAADGEAWVFATDGGRPMRLMRGVLSVIGWR